MYKDIKITSINDEILKLPSGNNIIDVCRYAIWLHKTMDSVKEIINREPSGKPYQDECTERYIEIALLIAEGDKDDERFC